MNIAIISSKLNSIDGVSLEAHKWQEVFERLGHKTFLCAGSFQETPTSSVVIPELDYTNEDIARFHKTVVQSDGYRPESSSELRKLVDPLKKRLYSFIADNRIELLDVENLISLPLNLPAGVALVEIVLETTIPVICRHHDFYWERESLRTSGIYDFLRRRFPPHDDETVHIVINTIAQREIKKRHNILSTRIPNVLDRSMVTEIDDFNHDFKEALDIDDADSLLFVQPSRIIERKVIERSIELIARLNARDTIKRRCVFLITGPPANGNLDDPYCQKLIREAREKDVKMVLAHDRIFIRRKTGDRGKIYAIGDAYAHADLVTFPSHIEGFGNPVIEACANKLPLFVNRYPVLKDMLDKGMEFALMDGVLTDAVVDEVERLLLDTEYRRLKTEHNFDVVEKYFSPITLEVLLSEVIERATVASIPGDSR